MLPFVPLKSQSGNLPPAGVWGVLWGSLSGIANESIAMYDRVTHHPTSGCLESSARFSHWAHHSKPILAFFKIFAVSPLLCCLRNWWIWNIQFDCSRIWIKRIWKVTNISNIRIRIIENTQKQFDVKKNLWLLFWDFYIFDINRPYQMSIPPTRYFALIKEHITPQNTPESRWWEVARLTFKWDKR